MCANIYDTNIEKLTKINEKFITTGGQSNRSDKKAQQKSYLTGYMPQNYYDKFCNFMKKYDNSIHYHIVNPHLKLYTTNRQNVPFEILTRISSFVDKEMEEDNIKSTNQLASHLKEYDNYIGFGEETNWQDTWKNLSFMFFTGDSNFERYPWIGGEELFTQCKEEVLSFIIISAKILEHDMQDIILEFITECE